MQKDSSCEKRTYRKRGRKPKAARLADETPQEVAADEYEADDIDVASEVEEEGTLLDRWSNADGSAESDELDDDEIEDEDVEREEERKKAVIEERRRIRRENRTINYVDPAIMEKRIEEYYRTDVMTEELAGDIRKICERLSLSARFVNYTYRDEMASDAFLSAYKAIYFKKFKLGRGYNPFSYITQVAFHSMVQRIKTEHKERDKTDSFRDSHFDDFMRESCAEQNAANEGSDSEWGS